MVGTHLAQRCAALKVPLTSDAVQSATATVWIAFRDRGIQPDGIVAAEPAAAPPIPTTPAASGRRLPPPVSIPDAQPGDDDLPFN
jgi:hypothetical protein